MEKIRCCLCGEYFEGHGNNPYPLCDKDDYDSRCCNDCDTLFVIPARMKLLSKKNLIHCNIMYTKYRSDRR